ncbi:MAG TPA: asparagine synthase (glutamine-hydrolyzing) [Bacteroidia bacterium]|jgi:asparagine synthase (glutamine-hydrolysing)|nr:asparagine synthase (glutamine-hydrolyzing) [Bacteroidia bacterium]
MCGITGIRIFSGEPENRIERVRNATSRLEKRGPDSQGIFIDRKTALGHRRLSIIDISDAGAQPFSDPTGRYTIVFNGEFFNYREHREILLSKGYHFRSESDTEVLLQLWILEKEKCLEKINGFFAFAIYDRQEESLFIARDRYGVKPLLYSDSPSQFVFASEMKSILEYGLKREIDFVSLNIYLQLNYIPAPDTIFSNIKKLEPGHYMNVRPGGCEIKKYYELPPEIKTAVPNYEEAKVRVCQLLEEAVERRLISDVPLGSFLSGGIDSSIVTAIASRFNPGIKTFSIGFPDQPFFDETKYAELVARKFKTNHTTFSLKNEELFASLHDALNYLDEPFADSSALLVYILSRHTRQSVTVALTGDGADELFTGYHKHAAEFRIRHMTTVENLVSVGKPLWAALPKSRNSGIGNKIRQFHKFSEGALLSEKERYWRWAGYAKADEVAELLVKQTDNVVYESRRDAILKDVNTDFNSLLRTDFKLVLQNDMLVKTDLMSMANGLELRSPFLDYRLVDYVFSLPEEYKINRQSRKRILRDAYKDMLPPEIMARGKHGFEVPLLKWFRTEMKSLIFEDLLNDDFIREQGIFNQEEIEKLKQKLFSSNPEDITARIWGLIVFQFWWKKYME